MADDFDRFAFNREANDWDEFNSLGALDDAPPPNPRFVRALRGELMNRAETLAQPLPLHGRRHAAHAANQSSLAAPPLPVHRKRWDRTLMFEAIAVAVLLVALIGSITMRGGNGGGNETAGGVINPPVLENEHTSWMYRQDAARTNVSPDSGPVTTPKLDWRATLDAQESVVAIADGVIVTIRVNSTSMRGLSVETGTPVWTAVLESMNPDTQNIAAGSGYLFVSWQGPDASISAFDLKTGSLVWTSKKVSSFASEAAVDNGQLFYLAEDRTLKVVDVLSGDLLWSVDVTAESSKSTPGANEDSIFNNVHNYFAVAVGSGIAVVTGGDGTISAINLDTKERIWSFTTDGNIVTTPTIADKSVYISSQRYDASGESKDDPDAAGWTYRLDAATGNLLWKQETGAYSNSRVTGLLGDDLLILNNRTLLNRADGTTVAQLPGDEENYFGSWTFGKDAIYSIDNDGNLIAWQFDLATQALSESWSAYVAAPLYESQDGLTIVGDRLLIRGPNSTLIALGADSNAPDSAAASGTPSALDFSGLVACSPPPPVDYLNVTGEPANTLQTTSAVIGDDPIAAGASNREVVGSTTIDDRTVSIINDPTRQPWFATEDVPTGTPATQEVLDGINATLQAVKDCNQPGRAIDFSGYYSEDFYRRSWVQAQIEQYGGNDPFEGIGVSAGVYWLNEIQSVTVLPDGRVAVLGQPGFNVEPNDFSMFVVFVQQGDTWVIDESIRVGLFALMG